MKTFDTPILFIIFNRIETTQKVFAKIKEVEPKYLYIAADGPREQKPGEEKICQEVRDYVLNNINWDCNIKTLFREKNLGYGESVNKAINWFFDNVKEGIILEDDCVPSNSFFSFCFENLEKYRNNEKIMSISGNFFDYNKNYIDYDYNKDYHFSMIPHIWGWATWKRAWDKYDFKMNTYKNFIKNKNLKKIFEDKKSILIWKHLLDQVYLGHSKTWDFQWTYTLFYHQGLSINPNKNLVSNIGFNKDAENCKNENNMLAKIPAHLMNSPIQHPKDIIHNKEIDRSTTYNHFNIGKIKYFFMKINLFNTFQPFYKYFKKFI